MGIATFLVAFVPGYALDRHLGRGHPDRPAHDPGHRRRRRMGRLGAAGDGMVAHPRPARPGRVLAAVRRAVRPVPGESRDARRSAPGRAISSSTWGWRIPFVAHRSSWSASACGSGSASWRRRCSSKLLDTNKIEQTPIVEVIKQAAEGDHPVGAAAHGGAGAVLHLHRLHLRLRHRHAEDVARPDPGRGAGRRPACRSSRIPLSGHISDRIGRRKMYLIGAA